MANQKKFIVDGGLHVSHDSQILANVEMGGHIIPNVDSDGTTGYDLGSPTMKWRDLYLSEGSLYIDNQKVVESSAGTIVVRADEDQSLTVKTEGTGVLTFQSEQTINFAGTLQMSAGKRITDAGGDAVTFGDKVDLDGNRVVNLGAPINETDSATKKYVDDKMDDVIGGAPGTLDTLNELANALGDDANFASTVVNNIATSKSQAIATAESYTDTREAAITSAYNTAINVSATATANAYATAIANATSSITNNYTVAISNESSAIATAYASAIATATTNITNAYTADIATAKGEAISTASADATAKADAAQAAAAADATAKADAAQAAAQSYADTAASTAVSNAIDSAPGALDTLNELAAALNDDANFASTVTNNIATAKNEAISTAASDAQTKASAAQSAAISAASSDAQTKASAAQAAAIAHTDAEVSAEASARATAVASAQAAAIAHADAEVSAEASARATAVASAVATAAADATAKADQALVDAKAYADTAEADAVATAAADATAKANAALADAQSYADTAAANVSVDLSGYATETYADTVASTAVSNVINGAPGALNTLNELAAAMGDDANFASTVTNNIATKVSKSGDTMTGTLNLHGSVARPLYIHNSTNGGGAGITFCDTSALHGQTGTFEYKHQDSASNGYANSFHFGSSETSLSVNVPASGDYFVGTNKVFSDRYHPNADKWTTARTLTISGDAAGSTSWDGSGNASISVNVTDSEKLGGVSASKHTVTTAESSASVGGGWITVAHSSGGRSHSEVIVSDSDSGDHAFIRIDWMRSYADSNFSVLQVGGHGNRITGARVLYNTADNTYGSKYLQVYVTTSSTYRVKVTRQGAAQTGWATHASVTPVVENSKAGYAVHGAELTGLDAVTMATEEGFKAGGSIYAHGDVTAYSDASLKTNVQTIDGALGKVDQVRGVTFERIADGSVSAGVVAQELEAVLPEAVKTDAHGVKAVAYGNITGLLIEAVKELKGIVETQAEEIKKLKD